MINGQGNSTSVLYICLMTNLLGNGMSELKEVVSMVYIGLGAPPTSILVWGRRVRILEALCWGLGVGGSIYSSSVY